jgi:PAS domain S-box-containing protein
VALDLLIAAGFGLAASLVLIAFSLRLWIVTRRASRMAKLQKDDIFRALTERSLAGIFIYQDGVIKYNNPAYAQILGYDAGELIGANPVSFIPADEREPVEEHVRKRLAGEEITAQYETRMRRKDGCLIDVLVQGSVIVYEGRMAVCGNILDITERKQADAAVRESEERFRKIIEQAPVAIGIGRHGIFIYTNPAFAKLFALDHVDELIGEPTSIVVAPEYLEEFLERSRLRELGAPVERDYEVVAIRKDGSRMHLRGAVSLMELPDGPAAFGVYEDITLRKEAERAMHRYREELEELVQRRTAELVEARNQAEAASRAKSAFLANMSHELRTPLNAVLGFSNILRNNPVTSKTQRETLDIILRSGEHLLTLINDVLDVARIEAGKVILSPTSFDLSDMMRDITQMMRLRAEEKGLELLYTQPEQAPRIVRADAAKIRQVLINLITNAIKYTEHGAVTLRLSPFPESSDATGEGTGGEGANGVSRTFLTFAVLDTGVGIASDDLQRIFEPFVQVGAVDMRKGTGLGLTITRQYLELMGGWIDVESAVGIGSCFRAIIPVELSDASEIEVVAGPSGRIIGLAPGQPEYRILIVEDQPENAILLRTLLEDVGFYVRVAADGAAGVDVFREWRPHFIWMDRFMPIMDGLQATRAIRELPGGYDVKISGLSASAFQDQRNETIASGMDDFVCKPFRASEIFDCMTRHLGVKFVTAEKTSIDAPAEAPVLSRPALAALPGAVLEVLENAVTSLNAGEIAGAIHRVAEIDPTLAESLSALAGGFAYTAILHAVRACRNR